MNRNCLRAREPHHRPSKPAANDFRLAIARGETRLAQLIAFHNSRRTEAERTKAARAVEDQKSLLAAWRASLAAAIDAKAERTNGNPATRLARAAEKRRRKAEKRRAEAYG